MFLILLHLYSQNYLIYKLSGFLIILMKIHCRHDMKNGLQLFGIFDVSSHVKFDELVPLP